MDIVVGITGASGTIYAIKLLEKLKENVYLVVSENAKKILKYENSIDYMELSKYVKKIYEDNDISSPIASGSFHFDAMVVVPASMNTVSKIACGISDTLITRVASIALKERRKIIVVPREMPLSSIHLENLKRLSDSGAIIMPASPGFYLKPKSIDDIVDFVVYRIIDSLGINMEHKRWQGFTY